MTTGAGTFLPGLTQAFISVDAENPVKTADFASACKAILPIFDHLGMPAVAGPDLRIPPKGSALQTATCLHAELMASFCDQGACSGLRRESWKGRCTPAVGSANEPSALQHRNAAQLGEHCDVFIGLQRKSLESVQDKYPTLHDVVKADKEVSAPSSHPSRQWLFTRTTYQMLTCQTVQANCVTKKNSCSRNLFRLCHGVLFISELLKYMYKDKAMPLRSACGQAYDNTLAAAHSWMVKNAIRTSMYMLPTREQFLNSIKETGGHRLHMLLWPDGLSAAELALLAAGICCMSVQSLFAPLRSSVSRTVLKKQHVRRG